MKKKKKETLTLVLEVRTVHDPTRNFLEFVIDVSREKQRDIVTIVNIHREETNAMRTQ